MLEIKGKLEMLLNGTKDEAFDYAIPLPVKEGDEFVWYKFTISKDFLSSKFTEKEYEGEEDAWCGAGLPNIPHTVLYDCGFEGYCLVPEEYDYKTFGIPYMDNLVDGDATLVSTELYSDIEVVVVPKEHYIKERA